MARAKRARTTSTEAPAKPAASVKAEPTNGNGTSSNLELEPAIRARAYQLYEQRGRQHGFDQQDWLEAESELLSQHTQRSA